MEKYNSNDIAKATEKLYKDLDLELSGKKPLNLFPKLYDQYELNKKVNRKTGVTTFAQFSCSMKIADIDFLVKNGYLKKLS